jgi:hypothetical protein
MAKRNKAVEVLEGAAALSEANTYIKRLIEDVELREAVGRAIESSRSVYERVSSAKKASKLLDDKKLQADALEAVDAIRTVTLALTSGKKAKPRKARKSGRFGRKLILLSAGGGVALVASEGLRSKVLDALFGAEEEFEYSPPPPASSSDAPGSPLSAV